jgi:hypothetical protein
MLQIEIEKPSRTKLVLTLTGDLCGPSADELMARWEELERSFPGRDCIVDLSFVSSMDDEGRGALCVLAHDGVRFLARGPMLGPVIDLVCKASVEALEAGRKSFRSIVFNH